MTGRGAAAARGVALGGAVGVLATAAGTAVAAHFARQVVTPTRDRPDDVRVREVTPGTVVLRAGPASAVPGRYGLEQGAGAVHVRVGEVIASDRAAGTVTRRLIGVDAGAPAPGPARWSGWYFTGDPTSALGLAHEDVLVPSDVGDLPAWQVPGDPGVHGPQDVWAVLVHGRGATREECLRALPVLHRLGVPALVPAYRNDVGAPSSADGRYGLGGTEWVDVEAAVLHALAAGARDVVLVGWSMGAAIALSCLSRSWTADRVRAVVLDGPVLDWGDVLRHHARLRRLPAPLGRLGATMLGSPLMRAVVGHDAPVDLGRMDWVSRAQELRVPLLLLHGDEDEAVPVGPSHRLARARPDLVTHVGFPGAGHCREWNSDPDRWEREVARFLLQHL